MGNPGRRNACPPLTTALLVASMLLAPALHAQTLLTGVVRADSGGQPLSGVEVIVEGTGLKATTGTNGRYLLENVQAGRRFVLFRQIGYLPYRIQVSLVQRDTVRVNAQLVAGVMRLDSIVVEGAATKPRGLGVEGFEERQRLGSESSTPPRNSGGRNISGSTTSSGARGESASSG